MFGWSASPPYSTNGVADLELCFYSGRAASVSVDAHSGTGPREAGAPATPATAARRAAPFPTPHHPASAIRTPAASATTSSTAAARVWPCEPATRRQRRRLLRLQR